MSAEPGRPWADETFDDDAAKLRKVITQALTAACVQSRDAQDVSRARRKHPFGSALWTLQFQELADRVAAEMPDRHRLEDLDNYSLVIVGNCVLYPVRSVNTKSAKAKDGKVRKPVSKLRRRMFSVLGPKPYQGGLWPELAGDDHASDLRTLIARLGADTRLVAISYVCSYKTGLTDIYWGEAELDARNGALVFHDGEGLSLTSAPSGTNRSLWPAGSGTNSRAFDGGEPPEISLDANPSHQAPRTEPELPQPSASDEEE